MMMGNFLSRIDVRLGLVAGLALLLSGCGQEKSKPVAAKGMAKGEGEQVAKVEHRHDGWWCDEHGITEAECSMCNGKVAAEFKKKGDWCDMHDRAKSQCFLCDPKLKEKFAAQYRAKFGKEPPATEEEKAKDTTGK